MKAADTRWKIRVPPLLDSLLLLSVGACSLLRTLAGWPLVWPRAVIAALILVLWLPRMAPSFRIPAWIFTLLGAGLLLWKGAPPAVWAGALNAMLQTVAIIVVMQTLSITIGLGNYSRAISDTLRKYAKNQGVLFFLVELFAHLLCSILNIGEVIILLGSFDGELTGQIEDYPQFMSGAVPRGHSTAFLWAPGSVTVLMTLQIFGLEWGGYVLPAVGLALLGMALGGGMEYRRLRSRPLDGGNMEPAPDSGRKILVLALVIAVIVAGVSLLAPLLPGTGGSERLVLVVAAVSALWLLSQCRTPGLGGEVGKFCRDTLPGSGSLCAFFISMGLFSGALQYVGLDALLDRAAAVLRPWPAPLLLGAVPLVIIAFSLIGVHPMVSLAVLGALLTQLVGNVTALQLALSTALGCCLAYMVSPFAGLILLLAHLLRLSPRVIALGHNLKFAGIYYVVGTLIIALL